MFDPVVPEQWKAAQNRDGSVIRHCWTAAYGYTVALTLRPIWPIAVIRPGEQHPFSYLSDLDQVLGVIFADLMPASPFCEVSL